MSDELFSVPVQLSPRQHWLNEQGVTAIRNPDPMTDDSREWVGLVHGNPKAFGSTSREAEDACAAHLIEELKLRHWSEE